MKKLLFAIMVIAGIIACNAPQKMTSSGEDTSIGKPHTDSSMMGDTMKRDGLK